MPKWLITVVTLSSLSLPFSGQTLTDPNLQSEIIVGCSVGQCPGGNITTMTFIGDDEFLYMLWTTGRVKHVVGGVVQPGSVLDLNVRFSGESGGLGIVADPDFIHNSFVYVYYTESSTNADSGAADPPALGNRVYRYRWIGGSLVDPLLILDLPARENHHVGGVMRFGPDDRLYVVVGDQGGTGQLQNTALGDPPDDTGVVFRIDRSGNGVSDNPFFDANDPTNPMNRYYAYGIRNSFGLAFDPLSGDLWETENGPADFDEINRISAGHNGGWRPIMGPDSRDPEGVGDLWQAPGSAYSDPELSWLVTVAPAGIGFIKSRKLGCDLEHDLLVTGTNCGALYRFDLDPSRESLEFGSIPELQDLVADNPGIRCTEEQGGIILGTGYGAITDIVTGPDGKIYLVELGLAIIHRISFDPNAMPDTDGDSVQNSCDCAANDASAFAQPTEVPRLRLNSSSPTSFGWDSQKGTAGDGTTYTVISGGLSDLRNDAGFALACTLATGVGDPPVTDPRPDPLPGGAYYYLIRATNVCADATYGDANAAPDPRDSLDSSTPPICL